jgi:hypothetical protein
MKDFFGTAVSVGDRVAFIPPGYRDLVIGEVVNITTKQVRIRYVNTWNYGRSGFPMETVRFHKTVIRAPQQ